MDVNAARETKRPIVLYVVDRGVKINYAANTVENVLADKDVKSELNGFTFVMADMDSVAWPQAYTARAHKGVAFGLLTSDGGALGFWQKGRLPSAKAVVNAARMVKARNPSVLARLEKSPVKKFEGPKAKQKAAEEKQLVAEKGPEEKKGKKAGAAIPGLNDDKKEDGKKPEAGKKPEKKVEEED